MQLPRGTFREKRKQINLATLLGELELTRFTGICSVSKGKTIGTLVLQNGRSVLADFQDKSGDAAWKEFVKTGEVDASLSSLDETEVQRAMEFNKTSQIQNWPVRQPGNTFDDDAEKCSEPSSFENDIATFDRMNLEEVAEKIRKDCKIMIKDLNLEHLIKPE